VSLAVITVNNQAPALDKKYSETQLIARALSLAAQSIGAAGGTVTSGNIVNDGGVVIGSFVYTPQASS
jgi:hypothetical protein